MDIAIEFNPRFLVSNVFRVVDVSFLVYCGCSARVNQSWVHGLFCRILVGTLLSQSTETISFLLDGVSGAASRFWLYLTNTVCTGATVCVGYAWCLYVDFRVYRSIVRLRRRHLLLGAPLLALLVLLVANLFGTGVDLFHFGRQRLPSGPTEHFAVSAAVRLLCRERVAGA
jgi:hypothetical protein